MLDTDGINVWCAAGKGTFGTDDLVRRVEATRLGEVVSHRRLILPQFGAPGVAAHQIKGRCGFKVVWGPVMLDDLSASLDNRLGVTTGMRHKRFPLGERLALIPMEIVGGWKPAAVLLLVIFFASGLGVPGGYLAGLLSSGVTAATTVLVALLAGAVLVPLLLPWIPGRAFALKGLLVGTVAAATHLLLMMGVPRAPGQGLEAAAWLLMAASFTSPRRTAAHDTGGQRPAAGGPAGAGPPRRLAHGRRPGAAPSTTSSVRWWWMIATPHGGSGGWCSSATPVT